MTTTEQLLTERVTRIRTVSRPERIILFGSRARGTERPESDYDLLVIQPSREPRYRRASRFYTALADLPVETEVLVYTPSEVREWSMVPEAFVTTAVREGRVLYERAG